MKNYTIYKLEIALASGGRWEQHFNGRPSQADIIATIDAELIEQQIRLERENKNSEITKTRFDNYVMMVKLFWNDDEAKPFCFSCGTCVGWIHFTEELVAINVESDPGKGAA